MSDTILQLPPLGGHVFRLIGWAVQPGQALRLGQTLCLVEQNGRLQDIPTSRGGTVRRLLAQPGQILAPNAPLLALAASPRAGIAELPVDNGVLRLRRWQPAVRPRGSMLLLHGFAGGLETWNALATALAADGFAVIAPDLPAHGGTTINTEAPQDIARIFAEIWPSLEMTGPCHLVGHSMGGAVAVLLAEAEPEGLASLTLLAPVGFGVEIQGDFVGQILAAETPAELAEALRPLTREPMSLPSEALEGTLTALRRHAASLGRLAKTLTDGGRQRLDLSPVLAGLSVPSRILFGEADAILPWAAFRQPPHIPIHRLACGHMPHWEQLDVVRRLLAFADWQPAAAQYGTGDKQ